MTRLINADDIPWFVEGVGDIPVVTKDEIDRMPTVDAVPVIRCKAFDSSSSPWQTYFETTAKKTVRHGKWIKIHPQDIYECSECHQNVMTSDIECYKFCHHCGARMDEE